MRITGGQWRGRRLDAVRGSAVRPTTDRVREALFSILGPSLDGADVADLCCGSGALGIEALSRGAARADFVDLAPGSLAAARANLERCGADPGRWRLHRGDASRWLRRRLEMRGDPLIVLADPPYGGSAAEDLASVLADADPRRVVLAVLEHPTAVTPPLAVSAEWDLDTRTYGNSALTIMRPAAPDEPEALDG